MMPKYYFRLIDSIFVADYGVHDLVDETTARIEAVKLAQSLLESRPEFAGKQYAISVTDEEGTDVCIVPIDSDP